MIKMVVSSSGKIEADLMLKCNSLLNVLSGEILNDVDIIVKDQKVVFVGKNGENLVGLGIKVLKIRDGVVVPGLIDAHTHDLLCVPTEQTKIALIHGTTTLIVEPDELTSVMGLKGLKIFMDEVKRLPLKVYVLIPLAVPQDPLFSSIKAMPISAYKKALAWKRVVGLGETVNWRLILDHAKFYGDKFKLALKMGKIIEGHLAGARKEKLCASVCAGVSSCHEATNVEQALERLRLGLFLMIREGSIRRDLISILPGLINLGVDLNNVAFVTDGVNPIDLTEHGYMDHIVKKAIELGLDPVKAIQMATINPARHFRVDGLVGSIAPGRYADIVVLKSLQRPVVSLTITNGIVVARNGRFEGKLVKYRYPRSVFKTMKVSGELKPENFEITAPIMEGEAKVLVARLEDEIITRKEVEKVWVSNGKVKLDINVDIAKIAVIDRHFRSGRIGLGLIKGFGARIGAVASSLNFDENQLVVVGYNNVDMAIAANETVRLDGGIVLFDKCKLEALPLQIAGTMSCESIEKVAAKLKKINETLSKAGSTFNNPLKVIFFTTFLTLPEIRFTDRGVVDVKNRCYASLFIH